MVVTLLLWKKGSVSAASSRGGTLKVRVFRNPSSSGRSGVRRQAGHAGVVVAIEGDPREVDVAARALGRRAEEQVGAAAHPRVGGLDVSGHGPRDRIKLLAGPLPEELLLDQRPGAGDQARGGGRLSLAGDHHHVEIEGDVAAQRDLQAAGLPAAGEAAHLQQLVARLGARGARAAGDVLHEPEVGFDPRGDLDQRGGSTSANVRERSLPLRLAGGSAEDWLLRRRHRSEAASGWKRLERHSSPADRRGGNFKKSVELIGIEPSAS
jgi:hypothetical protein